MSDSKPSLFSRLLLPFAPTVAFKREMARQQFMRFYEAANPNSQRVPIRNSGSGDNALTPAAERLCKNARYLDENHDIAKAVLNDLERGIIGTGITASPSVRRRDGTFHDEFNKELRRKYLKWCRRPEVKKMYSMAKVQRLACRTWLRDGEVFAQEVMGKRRDFKYPTDVPFALELLEPDYIPFGHTSVSDNIVNGVKFDAWGAPKEFYVYRHHPGDQTTTFQSLRDLKPIPADRMLHVMMTDRLSQSRGVSVFASIFTRLDDIKDYEESERIAARVAAALTGYIKRNADTSNGTTNSVGDRTFEMMPGMVFDQLLPGEDIGMIKSDRPNTALEQFRNSQLRAATSGARASYPNVSRQYDRSYSAQRQDMVVQDGNYKILRGEFIAAFVEPAYKDFVAMALLSGAVKQPRDADPDTLYDAEFRGMPTPWIDPLKEVNADKEAVKAGFKSREQVIRDRTGDPDETEAQIVAERQSAEDNGVVYDVDNVAGNKVDLTQGAKDAKDGGNTANGGSNAPSA